MGSYAHIYCFLMSLRSIIYENILRSIIYENIQVVFWAKWCHQNWFCSLLLTLIHQNVVTFIIVESVRDKHIHALPSRVHFCACTYTHSMLFKWLCWTMWLQFTATIILIICALVCVCVCVCVCVNKTQLHTYEHKLRYEIHRGPPSLFFVSNIW